MSRAWRAIRMRLGLYRKLTRAGVRPSSVLLFPLRRRYPHPRNRIELVTGERIEAGPAEPLVMQFEEIWIDEGYRPERLAPGGPSTVVDIGANAGMFSVWAAKRLGAKQIIAIEPGPQTVRNLIKNLQDSGVPAASVLQVAVGGKRQWVDLYARGPHSMNTLFPGDLYQSQFRPLTRVRMITLDDIFSLFEIERCDILKLDCEGAEYDILFNASESTLAKIQNIVGEYHEGLGHGDLNSLTRFLEKSGFRVTVPPRLDVEGGLFRAER